MGENERSPPRGVRPGMRWDGMGADAQVPEEDTPVTVPTDLFSAVMRVRGMEANARSRYAEGFYCRKIAV